MQPDPRPAPFGAGTAPDRWSEFRVDDPAEALRLLKQLRDGGHPVVLSTPQGVAVSSQLWSLDPVREQLNFCADAADPRVASLAQADEAAAVAYLDSVKLQFELSELLLVHGPNSCALRARLPAVLYRFQRRGSFRVRSLDRPAPQARLRHPAIPDMLLTLRVVDVSAGGCALSLPDDLPALQPGAKLQGVRVELDGDTGFNATLKLQHVSSLLAGDGGVRLGCELLDLDGHAQRALQRYIDRTQQRRRLLAPA